MLKLLFLCMGNICRSPAAQAIMQHMVDERGLRDEFVIDSAGTIDYHEGELPDHRMLAALRRHGYSSSHRSRPFDPARDFAGFDLIVAMDAANARWLVSHCPREEYAKRVIKMGDYLTDKHRGRVFTVVPDPYYGTADDFELTIELLEDACASLLRSILNKEVLK